MLLDRRVAGSGAAWNDKTVVACVLQYQQGFSSVCIGDKLSNVAPSRHSEWLYTGIVV